MVPKEVNPKTKRRGQIIEAALKAFSRHGLKETSMDQIVQESGVSKGLLYWYFKSKDELIQAVFKSFFEGAIGMTGIAESSASAIERLIRFRNVAVSEIARVFRFRPIIQELYVFAFRNKAIKKLAKKEFDIYLDLLKNILQDGINRGEFRNVDPADVSNTIIAIIEGTSLLFFMGAMDADVGEQIGNGISLIIEAIKVPE
ncbi:MAG TPA: TetR/AcrR family transcriptional regulator [Candidatus Kryptonia bacterium]